jgi:pimeloyl-ACP methyl ester carboxylesterase
MSIAVFDQMCSRRVAVDGGEMFTIDTGEGPPVLLVHGSPVSSLEYRATIARLAVHFRVLAVDLLTFGRSSGPEDGADISQQVRALRTLLDTLQLDRFHLVVHDWGGPIGLGAAALRPDQIDRLVLLNTSVRPDLRHPFYWWPMVAPVLGEATLVWANAFSWALPLQLRAARQDRALRQRYRQVLRNPATRRTVLKLERMQGYVSQCELIQRTLPEIRGPQMIMWGEPDPCYRRCESTRMREMFPVARFVRLRGAGHFPPEDAPDEVAEEISAFLRQED